MAEVVLWTGVAAETRLSIHFLRGGLRGAARGRCGSEAEAGDRAQTRLVIIKIRVLEGLLVFSQGSQVVLRLVRATNLASPG